VTKRGAQDGFRWVLLRLFVLERLEDGIQRLLYVPLLFLQAFLAHQVRQPATEATPQAQQQFA
jgi:hypothetical protein